MRKESYIHSHDEVTSKISVRPGNDKALESIQGIIRKFDRFIYIDSRHDSAIHQINKWFEHHFFEKSSTLILNRRHLGLRSRLKLLSEAGYNALTFRSPNELPELIDKIVYYPINAYSNAELVKHTQSMHVFIGHGDSDKLASVNPIIKIYSHILVAGDIAVKRLKDSNIINSEHVESGKVIKIGMPYLGDNKSIFNTARYFSYSDVIKEILYCPTWEGVSSKQRYSSLDDKFICRFISVNFPKPISITVKCHPCLGRKEPAYIKYLIESLNMLASKHRVTYVETGQPKIDRVIKRKCKNINFQSKIDHSILDLSIVDISSMLSTSLCNHVPTIVLDPNETMLCSYPFCYSKKNSDMVLTSPDMEVMQQYRGELISLSDGLSTQCSNQELLHSVESLIRFEP